MVNSIVMAENSYSIQHFITLTVYIVVDNLHRSAGMIFILVPMEETFGGWYMVRAYSVTGQEVGLCPVQEHGRGQDWDHQPGILTKIVPPHWSHLQYFICLGPGSGAESRGAEDLKDSWLDTQPQVS